MKARCLCPKPDYIVMEFEGEGKYPLDLHSNVFGWQGDDNILFWRNATTECSRCGVPLCEKCGTGVTKDYSDMLDDGWMLLTKVYNAPYCPTCAEVIQ